MTQTTWVKIQKYIKEYPNKVVLVVKKRIDFLTNVHKTWMEQDKDGTIPYFVFYQWFADIWFYGLLLTVVYVDLFIIHGWLKWVLLPFSFGAIRWLWLDLIENTTLAIKGKT
jgi:hypothetical protein